MKLTEKQEQVFAFIKEHLFSKGYPPTIREICHHFGFSSPLSAKQHVDALDRKGYIKKNPNKQRGIEVVNLKPSASVNFPVLGRIRAGKPILAQEEIEEYLAIDGKLFHTEQGFALRVIGDSMIEAGIFEGDIVFIDPTREVRDGDIVIALIYDEEATVKRFYRLKDHVQLVPENKTMQPIVVNVEDIQIIGKVVGVIRRY
jgi:repressor LexA